MREWSDFVTVHSLPGPGVISALKQVTVCCIIHLRGVRPSRNGCSCHISSAFHFRTDRLLSRRTR